jgi:hypothetical protein
VRLVTTRTPLHTPLHTPLRSETATRPGRRVRGKLAAALVAAVIAVTAGPDVYAAATGATCHQWRWRTVDARPMTLGRVAATARTQHTVTVAALPGWADGLALPGVVVLSDRAGVGTWLHEHIHQEQMRQDGMVTFWLRYTGDFLRGRAHGCGAHDAYLAVSYEIEARRLEHHLQLQYHAPRRGSQR